jgi:hypothetical protein
MAPMVAGCMAKDPGQRWPMEQVRDFLAGSGEPAPRTRPGGPAALVEPAAPARVSRRAGLALLVGLAVVLAVVVALVLLALRPDATPTASPDPSASHSASPSGTPTGTPSPSTGESAPQGPTAAGMESFIRSYVAALSTDPDTAWTMLTPKFQRQSGGLATYRDFWSGVGDGTILALSADPRTLVVSYRVRFEHFGTGRRPTTLDLAYDNGRYRIDSERTPGFVPAG